MNGAIVTTTIHPPTKALEKFAEIAKKKGWPLIVVGDRKTPHQKYRDFPCTYLTPEFQEENWPTLSPLIGWDCIQRRNLGFLFALGFGPGEVGFIATVDDDNIPLDNWGDEIMVGQECPVFEYTTECEVFDPLKVYGCSYWHRGFPTQLLLERELALNPLGISKFTPLVQADLWAGEPDIDAIARIALQSSDIARHYGLYIERDRGRFASRKISPFNSQNTFIARDAFRHYFLFPGIGRMDDIWAGYYLQKKIPQSVIYGPITVIQERNPHNLVKDLEAELLGYKYSLEFIRSENPLRLLPKKSLEAFREYRRIVESILGPEHEEE